MSTFEEIEAAVARLSDEEAMVLMAKLMRRLHDPDAEPPKPREFTAEQMQEWIDDDEAEMAAFWASTGTPADKEPAAKAEADPAA